MYHTCPGLGQTPPRTNPLAVKTATFLKLKRYLTETQITLTLMQSGDGGHNRKLRTIY